jgi:hypothetical protein
MVTLNTFDYRGNVYQYHVELQWYLQRTDVVFAGTGTKPLEMPPARGTQGAWKLDWETEWFAGK